MARLATPELLKIAAWPTATLHAAPGGPVVGILMPKITYAMPRVASKTTGVPCKWSGC